MTPNEKSGVAGALVFAPNGRDAAVAQSLLAEAGIPARLCESLEILSQSLSDDICFAVLTEESVRSADLRAISNWVEHQPAWSDLTFIILTQRGGGPERNPAAARLSDVFGNVTFLERPFHPTTFVSVARSAKKGRLRQYDAREQIAATREGEKRLLTALTAGRLGSWQLNVETWHLDASPTCKALFGREPNEPFSYQDLVSSIHPDDLEHVRTTMQSTIDSGEDYAIECRVVAPNGKVRWAEIRARNVQDRDGSRSLIGVSSDVTARKSAEERLRRLNETLEERVAARTAELEFAHTAVVEEMTQRQRAEDLLRQSQKMEMIGQLTGGVAHDFNNLLMAVIGNLDLLARHLSNDAKAARLVDGALQGAKRGAALTQRLLAFARRQDLTVEPLDLVVLVQGMTDLLYRSAGDRSVLTFVLPDSVPATLVDANQIELALLNLVVNARDAMPEGGSVTITVDTVRPKTGDLPSGDYVRLTVTDTGHGMDADTLKKATEPFFSTKELGKGTGLGLSMIHGLALQLNGGLKLSSQLGQGTRAELWLPVTQAQVQPRAPSVPAPTPTNTGRLSILVVDDDALIAMSTVDMLEDLGHEVHEANSPAAALDVLRGEQPIDLMITDFAMPKMTGAELATAARELRPRLPILLATGYAELPSGLSIELPRLAKPYQQEQLEAEIGKLMASR